jgi:hypothetical protein
MLRYKENGERKMEKKNGKMAVDLVEQARQLRLQAEELERSARHARGTQRNVAPKPVPVVKPARSVYWTGDEGTTEQLMAVIQQMLAERPRLFREIVEATEAGENRIKGVIMRLQREGVRVVDVAPEGTGKALWFIPSSAVLERLLRAKKAATSRRG